ncbi:MAG: TfoX/Sxy family protein [Oscillibacter sp.]|nr:TfoX/Sxy family protein [Oscillibacter sp.]
MASSKDYLNFVLDQLSGVEGVSHRAMMGEFVLYCRGTVVGGIYDDRLLVKNTPAARALLPDAPLEIPYPGGKPMLLADVDDRELLAALLPALCEDLAR